MDVETQSAADLRKIGSRAYLRDSSTRLLSAVFLTENTLITWIPENRAPHDLDDVWLEGLLAARFPEYDHMVCVQDEVPVLVEAVILRGATFVAHNAENFDSIAWERFGEFDPTWYDTIHHCRAGSLPAGLDNASKALGGSGKDEAGGKIMKMLTRAKVSRDRIVYPVGTVAAWRQLIEYNVIDVLELKRVYEATRGYGEPAILEANSRMNALGVPVDLKLATVLKELWHQAQEGAKKDVESLTENGLEGSDVYSPQKVKAWLAKQGLVIKSLERKQIAAMMTDPDGWFGDTEDPTVCKVIEVIKARQVAARATVGKIDRVFRAADPDGRVRGTSVYFGAHTGRFSSRDLQMHNLPRSAEGLDVEGLLRYYDAGGLSLSTVQTYACAAKKCDLGDALASLMRPVICAEEGKTFAIADYAQIEGRVTAWFARCPVAMSAWEDVSRDPYCEMASEIFGHEVTKKDADKRQLGKKCVLGCGYGMGGPKFEASCAQDGIVMQGVTGEQCVKAYRDKFVAIKQAWRQMQNAAEMAVKTSRLLFTNRVEFEMHGPDLHMTLPNGRALIYRNARMVMKPPKWAPEGEPRPALVYLSPHGYEKDLYGGLIMENIVQAFSRDIMCHSIVHFQPTVLTVHDEVVDEVGEEIGAQYLDYMCQTMSISPPWAPGLPLRVEGFTSKRYVKKALSGAYKCDYMKGVKL